MMNHKSYFNALPFIKEIMKSISQFPGTVFNLDGKIKHNLSYQNNSKKHKFKSNQRKELVVSQRRKMKASARR